MSQDYSELVALLRDPRSNGHLNLAAADAVEALTEERDRYREALERVADPWGYDPVPETVVSYCIGLAEEVLSGPSPVPLKGSGSRRDEQNA